MANSNNNSNTTEDTDINPNDGINKEACAKYGITLSEIPTEPVEPYSRYNSDDTVYGFVTEVTHDQKGTEVEIKDWGYCLEENRIELGFENMKRSQIMEEVIKTYGLVPLVDLSGLRDDVISWDNSTSKSSSDSSAGTGGDSTGSESIDQAVDNAIKGKTSCYDKAEAIYEAFRQHCYYEYYYNCEYPNDLDKAWQDAHLNCADGANVLSAMFQRGGIKATIVATPGHYIVRVNCDGKDYFCDSSGAEGQHNWRKFSDPVYGGTTSGTDKGTHLSY